MAALQEYEVQLGEGPLLTEANGYRVEDIDGLGRSVRGGDFERPNADGSVQGPEYHEARTVTLTMSVHGDTPAQAMERVDALAAVWNSSRTVDGGLTTVPLRFRLPGRVTQLLPAGRPRRFAPVLSSLGLGFIPVVATYYSPDPRILADEERAVELTYGAAVRTLENPGNHPAAVVWDVHGAATNPGVIRSESKRFDLTAAVAGGAFYRVRTDARTVTRSSDSANRYQDFSGTFLEVPAGGALFRAVKASGTGTKVTAVYRDTWL